MIRVFCFNKASRLSGIDQNKLTIICVEYYEVNDFEKN